MTLNGEHRHPTQAYAFLWEFALLLVLRKVEPRLRTSGVLFNLWLIGHGAGRILMEVFRDDPRGELILGLSLGIWMALGLAVFGALNLLTTSRH
jgi:phosphatidylglycerol:prolipoprotein diacylglycerol transferase